MLHVSSPFCFASLANGLRKGLDQRGQSDRASKGHTLVQGSSAHSVSVITHQQHASCACVAQRRAAALNFDKHESGFY